MAFYGILVDDRQLAEVGAYGGRCLVRGRMWDVRHFPGVTLRGAAGDVAHARLWSPPADDLDRALVVAALDNVEGYTGDPATSMYMRRWVRLAWPADEWAWVYEWNYETDGLLPVPGGDWRAWTGRPWPKTLALH